MKRKESDDPRAWFAKAEEDRTALAILASAPVRLTDVICYHAQQCSEKYLKGYLKSRRVIFKWTHDLDYLIDLCCRCDAEFDQLRSDAERLTRSADLSRYPGDEEPATEEETRLAMQIVERVRGMVLQKMGS